MPRKYREYLVESECAMGICEGWRSFVSCCNPVLYQGRSYHDAMEQYWLSAVHDDGTHFATIICGRANKSGEWEIIRTNEINEVHHKPHTYMEQVRQKEMIDRQHRNYLKRRVKGASLK